MIACKKCDKWFHGECIGMSHGYNVEDVEYFHCGCSQKEIRYKKTSANAGGTDAAPSGTGGKASAPKEKPEDNGTNKKLVKNNGRMTRSKKAAEV
ncbi:hypothetical protein AAVH_01365 [Aphelenchoides avenae]|nr:hypothetical protein AAVH_01365 [Aphelenchus avenae]